MTAYDGICWPALYSFRPTRLLLTRHGATVSSALHGGRGDRSCEIGGDDVDPRDGGAFDDDGGGDDDNDGKDVGGSISSSALAAACLSAELRDALARKLARATAAARARADRHVPRLRGSRLHGGEMSKIRVSSYLRFTCCPAAVSFLGSLFRNTFYRTALWGYTLA